MLGMYDHVTVLDTHTFIVNHYLNLNQILRFLCHDPFARDATTLDALRALVKHWGAECSLILSGRNALDPTGSITSGFQFLTGGLLTHPSTVGWI